MPKPARSSGQVKYTSPPAKTKPTRTEPKDDATAKPKVEKPSDG